MLVALMLKVDVGWGQGMNLIQNSSLSAIGNGFADPDHSFFELQVPFWFSSRNTPSHVAERTIESDGILLPYCFSDWQKNFLYGRPTWREGVFTNVDFIFDDYVVYDLSVNARILQCESNTNIAELEFICNNGLVNSSLSTTSPTSSQTIGTLEYRFFSDQVRNIRGFKPNNSYSQLEVVPNSTLGAALTINNINLQCRSIALGEILYTNNENVYNFHAENLAGPFFPFQTYSWNFGDPLTGEMNTSLEANPVHAFSKIGKYNVCLEITDIHGCKSDVKCKEINVDVTCARDESYDGYYIINGAHTPTFSEYFAQNGLPNLSPGQSGFPMTYNFIVLGNVTIDRSYEFLNSRFVAQFGSKINIAPSSGRKGGHCTFNTCHFHGCSQMWFGLYLGYGSADFIPCTIEDALYGIQIDNASYIGINSCKFYKNFIGIYKTSNPGHSILGNLFDGTQNLFSIDGFFPYMSSKSWAGIYVNGDEGGTSLNLGTNFSNGGNIFKNLQNGVVSKGASLNCKGNYFENFNSVNDGLFPFTVKSTAIHIDGITNWNSFVTNNSFTNGSRAIALVNSILPTLTIQNNTLMSNFDDAIYIQDNLSPKIYIYENKNINNNKLRGVGGFNNVSSIWDIYDNDFSQTFLNSSISVEIQEINTSGEPVGDNVFFDNNRMVVNSNQTNKAIEISGFELVNITQCTLDVLSQMVSDDIPYFHLFNNDFVNFRYNKLVGTNTTNPAVLLNRVKTSAVCCNDISKFKKGIWYKSDETQRSSMVQNRMIDCNEGLLIEKAKIGSQNNTGNQWIGGNRRARLDGLVLSNRFIANPNQPNFWPVQNPTLWFGPTNVNAPITCGFIPCNGELPKENSSSSFGEEDIATLESMLDFGFLPLAYKNRGEWSAKRWLYQYISKYPAVIGLSEDLAQFYQNVGEDVASHEDMYNALTEVMKLSASDKEVINSLKNQIIELNAECQSMYEQFLLSDDSLFIDLYLNKLENLRGLGQSLLNVGNNTKHLKKAEVELIKTNITSLLDNEDFLQVSKSFATIMADHFIYGKEYTISENYLELNHIASLCEEYYGKTVMIARSLLKQIGGDVFVDDELACLQNDVRKSSMNNDINDVVVSPNPASRIIHISSIELLAEVAVFDIAGNQQMIIYDGLEYIDIGQLQNGVYILKTKTIKGQVTSHKIIKIQ